MHISVQLLALAAWVSGVIGRDGVLYAAAPQERGAYAVGTPGGRYNYGYNTGDGIAKVEVRQPDGSVVGSYRYYDPNGKQVVRSYVADKRGFRVLGNDLPISPDTPASQIAGTPAFTGAVEGTDEFAIPPPLGTSAIAHSSKLVAQQTQQHETEYRRQQQEAEYRRQQQEAEYRRQQQTQQHEAEHRRQQQHLEEQRRQLRVQQEKLAALQRELENQQLNLGHYQSRPHYGTTPNDLTGGYTSPYYYYQHDLNYDFPAGFAYTGMPTYSVRPTRIRYPKSTYVIGQAR